MLDIAFVSCELAGIARTSCIHGRTDGAPTIVVVDTVACSVTVLDCSGRQHACNSHDI